MHIFLEIEKQIPQPPRKHQTSLSIVNLCVSFNLYKGYRYLDQAIQGSGQPFLPGTLLVQRNVHASLVNAR